MSLPPFSYPTSARNVENPTPLSIQQGENIVDFQRDRHDPPANSNVFKCLENLLLDVIGCQTLGTASNVDPGPYFPTITSTETSSSELITSAPEGSCYWREFGSESGYGPTLNPILQHYGDLRWVSDAFYFVVEIRSWKQIDEKDNTTWYKLVGQIWALNVDRKPVCTIDENGLNAQLMTSLSVKWPVLVGVEDVAPSFKWKHIAAILRHEIKVSFKADGTRMSDDERDVEMMMNRNPLRQLGYEGWPRMVDGQFVDPFSRC